MVLLRRLELLLLLSTWFCLCRSEVLYTIDESAEPDHSIGRVLQDSSLITELDPGLVTKLQFSLMNAGSLPTDYFKIHNRTSQLRVARTIDRDSLCDRLSVCCEFEIACELPLQIAVQPISGNFFLKTIKVKIKVVDINDNSPVFQAKIIQGHVSEAAQIGASVSIPTNGVLLLASDRDSGQNGVQNYSIISPSGAFGLRIEQDYGIISDVALVTMKELDRETVANYKVIIVAKDGGKPPRSGSVTVQIDVDDANDFAPMFTNETYTVTLSEDVEIGKSVVQVSAKDEDVGRNALIKYSIRSRPGDGVSSLFTIDSKSGVIRTRGRLNFEDHPMYRISVQAMDDGFFVQNKGRATVVVKVRDVNDHPPSIKANYLTKSGRCEVAEDVDIGTFVAYLLVTDPDNDDVGCEIDNPMFKLIKPNKKEQNEYHLLTAHRLNRELQDQYLVTLTCTDKGTSPLSAAETLVVHILDANDNPPKFTQSIYTTSVRENNDVGAYLLQVLANDNDTGENAKIIYSLTEEGRKNFTIDSATGRVYAKVSFDRESYDQVHVQVKARDNGTTTQETEASVLVRITDDNDNRPRFHEPLSFEISEAAGAGVMLGQMSASDPDIGENAEIHFQLERNEDSHAFEISENGLLKTRVQLDREKQSFYKLVVVVKDGGKSLVQTSSVQVRVEVTDINDNPPIIHFPNTYKNTVYISYLEPMGQTITIVNSTDIDAGKNAFLDYSFTQGNEDRVFKINQNTGAIYVAKQLQKTDAAVYKLGIKVMDRAEPHNSNVEILNIVIDGTGKAISIDGSYQDAISSKRNLIIVICLAGISAVLAVVLIVAIICIKKKDRQTHRYNVKTETQRIYEKRGSVASEEGFRTTVSRPNCERVPMEAEDHNNGGMNGGYTSLQVKQLWRSPEKKPLETRLYDDLKNVMQHSNQSTIKGAHIADELNRSTLPTESDSDGSHHTDSGRGCSDDDSNRKCWQNDETNGKRVCIRVDQPRKKIPPQPPTRSPNYTTLPILRDLPEESPTKTLGENNDSGNNSRPLLRDSDSSSQIYASLQRQRTHSGATFV